MSYICSFRKLLRDKCKLLEQFVDYVVSTQKHRSTNKLLGGNWIVQHMPSPNVNNNMHNLLIKLTECTNKLKVICCYI